MTYVAMNGVRLAISAVGLGITIASTTSPIYAPHACITRGGTKQDSPVSKLTAKPEPLVIMFVIVTLLYMSVLLVFSLIVVGVVY